MCFRNNLKCGLFPKEGPPLLLYTQHWLYREAVNHFCLRKKPPPCNGLDQAWLVGLKSSAGTYGNFLWSLGPAKSPADVCDPQVTWMHHTAADQVWQGSFNQVQPHQHSLHGHDLDTRLGMVSCLSRDAGQPVSGFKTQMDLFHLLQVEGKFN